LIFQELRTLYQPDHKVKFSAIAMSRLKPLENQ
jgi:hypothetical protein